MSSSVDRTRQHDDEHQHHERFDEASSSSSSGVHVVSPGDSLYGVAVYYGVDPRDLIAANAKTLGGYEYVLPGQRLVIPGRMSSGGGQRRQHQSNNACGTNDGAPPNSALDGGERQRRQQQRQQVYKSGNISSNFLAEKGGPTTMTRMPTIVTAVSFVFGLAFGLFLFSRERE